MSTIKSSAENLTLNADGANNDIKFQSNGVEKASIDQDGLITAGGATLTGQLKVQSSSSGQGSPNTTYDELVLENSGHAGLSILSGTGSYGGLVFGDSGDSMIGALWYDHSTNSMSNFVNNTEYMRIHSNGVTSIPSGVALGVAVSANTASNVLDDYEEGTWTPAFSVGSGSLSMASVGGTYTKVGRKVTLIGRLEVSSVSSPSGQLTLTGFPFTSGTGITFYTAFMVQGSGWASSTTDIYGIFTGNTAYIFGFASGGQTAVADKVEANTNMSLCITYHTA